MEEEYPVSLRCVVGAQRWSGVDWTLCGLVVHLGLPKGRY